VTAGLLAVLLAFPSSPARAASVTVTIGVDLAETGAPSFTWTLTGCSASPSSGTSGTPVSVTMTSSCAYTISSGGASGNGTLRDRLTGSYTNSVSETSCSGGTCPTVSITAYAQEYLSISSNCDNSLVSVQSPTSDSWYNYGTSLTVSCAGAWGRSGGTGTRAASWSWDAGASNFVATTGYFSSSLETMVSHHTFNVNKITQYQLTLDQGATKALEALTAPAITSDNFWYDSGAAVTYQGYGVFGRANGFGNRSASWYLDSGTPTLLSTSGTFTISVAMSSEHLVHVLLKPQWQVSLDSPSSGLLESITSPTVAKDNYWYDAGTVVSVVLSGVGPRSAGVGSRLVSYSLNGGTGVMVATTGSVSVLGSVPISGKEFITATTTAQYQLLLDPGSARALTTITPPSIAGDNYWYDSGILVTYTGTGAFGRTSGTGTRVASWWLDSGTPVELLTTGTFSAMVSMLGTHTIHTQTGTQYQVALVGTYGVSSATPPTISGDDYWYDGGTVVSLSLQGEFGRTAGTGWRMTSYSVNGGPSIPTMTGGALGVLASIPLTSPQTIDVQAVRQYQVTFDQGIATSLNTVTGPTLPGDNYWYDSGSAVSITVHGTWARDSTEGFRLTSYSINGAAPISVASSGTVTILDLTSILGPQSLTSNTTVQYPLLVSGGSGSTYSVSPPIKGDTGWYDSGTTVRVSTNGTYDTNAGVRQRVSGWSVDGSPSTPVGVASRVTAPAMVMTSAHSLVFYSITQYLVTLVVKDNTGSDTLTPDSIALVVNGGSQMASSTFWIDSGASLQVASISWHGVDVAPSQSSSYVVSAPLTVTVNARVYDATITVKDIFGFPLGGADCSIILANGTAVHESTSGEGTVTLDMIPLGTYQGTTSAFGLSSSFSGDASTQGNLVTRLPLSWAVIIIIVVIALAAVLAPAIFLRRRRPRYRFKG
jgi:hypothetical protein